MKVVHVFQFVYSGRPNGVNSGLGDFLRGSWALHELFRTSFKRQYPNIELVLDFSNHASKEHLISPGGHSLLGSSRPVPYYSLNEKSQLIQYLSAQLQRGTSVIPIGTNLQPTQRTPSREFIETVVKKYLQPSPGLIASFLTAFPKDIAPHSYDVVHIRFGDPVGGAVSSCQLADATKKLLGLFGRDPPLREVFVVADNVQAKHAVSEKFGFRALQTDVAHSAGRDTNSASMRDVWIDFFFISNARKVYSVSAYPHGSGFSEWAARFHNVEFIQSSRLLDKSCKY
jgi:hypothetical protein